VGGGANFQSLFMANAATAGDGSPPSDKKLLK